MQKCKQGTSRLISLPPAGKIEVRTDYVLPGAIRLNTSARPDCLAFKNRDGAIVLILMNTTEKRFRESITSA